MTLSAKWYGGKAAALIYAIPVQFTIAAIFIYLDQSSETIRELSVGTLYSILILAGFVGLFCILTQFLNFWSSLTCSYLAFFIAGYFFLRANSIL